MIKSMYVGLFYLFRLVIICTSVTILGAVMACAGQIDLNGLWQMNHSDGTKEGIVKITHTLNSVKGHWEKDVKILFYGTLTDEFFTGNMRLIFPKPTTKCQENWEGEGDLEMTLQPDGNMFIGQWQSFRMNKHCKETTEVQVGSFKLIRIQKILPKIKDIFFIRKTDSGHKEIREIGYEEPFYIKVVFYSAPEEKEKTVTLDWNVEDDDYDEGDDDWRDSANIPLIIVEQEDDNKEIYLSDTIYVERP